MLVYDPAYYPQLTQAIQAELERAGVHPVLALNFDPPSLAGPQMLDPALATLRGEEVVALLRPVFAQADLFLWLPARALAPDLRWERLLEASRARGIHFHWILPLAGRDPDEVSALSRMYERAILDTDYAALSATQDRLAASLRGKTVRITTAEGTNLRLRVPAGAWFHKNDGNMSAERARAARSARDREMELPAGALRFIPDPSATAGRLVVRRAPVAGGPAENARFDFEAGRVVRVSAAANQEGLLRTWKDFGGDVDKVGEVVIGTNPLLNASLPSGELPYFGYGAGYVRISLGDNWESGGSNRTAGGRPLWLFLERATVEADGQVIVREGRLVDTAGDGSARAGRTPRHGVVVPPQPTDDRLP